MEKTIVLKQIVRPSMQGTPSKIHKTRRILISDLLQILGTTYRFEKTSETTIIDR